MEKLLGLPLDRAREILEAAGKTVRAVETRSRKGVPGTDARVVRVRECGDTVELVYAIFQTNIIEG